MTKADLNAALSATVRFLRRYARALTGTQREGDRLAAAAMESLIQNPAVLAVDQIKVDLFRTFHRTWVQSGTPQGGPSQSRKEAAAQARLAALLPNTREALLLSVIEGFSGAEIAYVLEIEETDVDALIAQAFEDVGAGIVGDVLVIEDEQLIAMDLREIVVSMGHSVTGTARTMESAVELGKAAPPDLILADIKLADGSSGIDAVQRLLSELGEVPVIFITAFPERLLKGEKHEPAFLISKPYSEDQVRAAVSQAMFFASTDGLTLP